MSARYNYVYNSQALTNTTGWVLNAATGTITRDLTKGTPLASITGAIKFVSPNTNSFEGIQQNLTTPLGFRYPYLRGEGGPQRYYISFYAIGNAGGESLTLQLGSGGKDDLSRSNYPYGGSITLTTSWARYGGAVTVLKSDETRGYFQMWNGGGVAQTYWITGIMIEATNTLGSYFDSTFANTAAIGSMTKETISSTPTVPWAQWPVDTNRISAMEMRGQDAKAGGLGEGSASQALARSYFFDPQPVRTATRRFRSMV